MDPKFALEEVEEETAKGNSTEKITSLKKLLTKKVNRSGYDENNANLFAECDLMEFLKSSDPHEFLSGFNKFTISQEAREAIQPLKAVKGLEEIIEDLKVCGRKEFSDLLRLRHNYIVRKEQLAKEEKAKRQAEN